MSANFLRAFDHTGHRLVATYRYNQLCSPCTPYELSTKSCSKQMGNVPGSQGLIKNKPRYAWAMRPLRKALVPQPRESSPCGATCFRTCLVFLSFFASCHAFKSFLFDGFQGLSLLYASNWRRGWVFDVACGEHYRVRSSVAIEGGVGIRSMLFGLIVERWSLVSWFFS